MKDIDTKASSPVIFVAVIGGFAVRDSIGRYPAHRFKPKVRKGTDKRPCHPTLPTIDGQYQHRHQSRSNRANQRPALSSHCCLGAKPAPFNA
ncbi:hypothetical protein PL263_18820 [Methylomonas sp. EFPC3]|uniref:hypothetical protein n=1 Tax=Methylomonas TaxID=416 RepID=UPI00112E7883|nr:MULTISPECIES: hypothetical protein [Methylomonas]WFP50133.1 hypothetical protein PL263_18820 [Methylomonas sp. EFPC3]